MSTTEDAKPSAEEAAGASLPSTAAAAVAAPGGGSPHKLPLIITGTEEHGPFVPPKPEDIHDVKPALKKQPHIGADGDGMMDDAGIDGDDEGGAGEDADHEMEEDGGNKKKKAKKALKWDEHAIEEHDLLRGTRMKVSRTNWSGFTAPRIGIINGFSSSLVIHCHDDTARIFTLTYHICCIHVMNPLLQIEEPKTPFSHYDHEHHSDDDSAKHPRSPPAEDQGAHHGERSSIDEGMLGRKLASVAAVREFYPSSPSASSRDGGGACSDEEEAKKHRQHEREFGMHRKHHYNEMEMLRRFREQHPGGLLDGEDDDEDDEDESGNGGGEKMEEG